MGQMTGGDHANQEKGEDLFSKRESDFNRRRALGSRRDGKTTVLLADNNPIFRQVLESALTSEGYCVILASDGEEAWVKLQREKVDILLSDIPLPKLNGFGLCKRVQGNTDAGHLPMIFFMFDEEAKDKIGAFEVGAVEFISKSISLDDIIARIREAANSSSSKQFPEGLNSGMLKTGGSPTLTTLEKSID